MHELSIAQSIVDAVETKAIACRATQVKSVHLQIGVASGVVIGSLSFCFHMLADFVPLLVGAQLMIEEPPHRARCEHCDTDFTILDFIPRCPQCQTWETRIISGTELQILFLEIETESTLEFSHSSCDDSSECGHCDGVARYIG